MAINIITKITQKITETNTGKKQRSKKRTIRKLWALGRSGSNWHFKHAWVFAFTRAWNNKIAIYERSKNLSHQQLQRQFLSCEKSPKTDKHTTSL